MATKKMQKEFQELTKENIMDNKQMIKKQKKLIEDNL